MSLRLLVLCGILGILSCWVLRELRVGDAAMFWPRLARPDVFVLAVFAIGLWRAARCQAGVRARNSDFFYLTLVALAAVPLAAESSHAGLGLCTGALGAWLLLHARGDNELRAAAICMLALCANLSIAPLFFRLAYHGIIGLDMALLQIAIDLTGASVTATPAGLVASDGMRVMLVGGCSSFMGVSTAVLVHMGWAMTVRTEVTWRDSIAVLGTVVLATLLNVVRLTLTASSREGYAFWHGAEGEITLGGEIVWFVHHAILLTGGYLSAYWAGRSPARRLQPT
jgi:hypothetical protein